ncbi:uncharacterized protein MELLADRAFT_36679 [Melampsora larici-populina 98AG31]|uniref:3-beta hydroxysteroid dehydrogenase/isomerase domain-containing protein n=1 Tax=Melampsora larici-populina (strain 98AG31 / pathotype 3-4-7) TaxID=747676 RepID=F4RPJ4_MELLP|nr:uncharacterized protein MELLADRAFT_36679 [Melampsora larici-populina 98AG31]EGG05542.1 hypothetical protein MELLADRAFT_36679 [Melampsora larici-populina 98AG31]
MTIAKTSSGTSYFVIGGEGFLGHNLISELVKSYPDSIITSLDLVQRYFTSRPIDLPNESDLNPTNSMQHSFIKSDLTSLNDLINSFDQIKPDVVFHTASPWIGSGREVCEKVNIQGTENVIEACKKFGVQKLVYTSSAGVVYNGEDLINVDERLPIPENALDHYNITKAKAEAIVLKANDNDKLLTCALRPAGIFGPGDRQAIPGIIQVLKNGQHRIQIGSNKNLFDWTYVDNVVHAHLLAATRLEGIVPVAGEAFFITGGEPVYFWDFTRSVWKAYATSEHLQETKDYQPIPSFLWIIPKFLGVLLALLAELWCKVLQKPAGFTTSSVRYACATRFYNIEKARVVLGYEPVVGVEEGISRAVEVKISFLLLFL